MYHEHYEILQCGSTFWNVGDALFCTYGDVEDKVIRCLSVGQFKCRWLVAAYTLFTVEVTCLEYRICSVRSVLTMCFLAFFCA